MFSPLRALQEGPVEGRVVPLIDIATNVCIVIDIFLGWIGDFTLRSVKR